MAKKLIHTTPDGVKVYRDSEWEQFIVIPAGMKPSDDDAPFYFTDDKEDALSTADAMGRKENPSKKKHPGHRAHYTVKKWTRERNTTYGNAVFSFTVEDESGTRHSGKTKPNYDFVIGLPMLYSGDKISAIIETTPSGRTYMTDAEILRARNPVRPLKKSAAPKRKTAATTQKAAEAYVHRNSQITKKAPSKRLKTRRTKNLRIPTGYFPNPLQQIPVTEMYGVFVEHEGDRYYFGGMKGGKPVFDSDVKKALLSGAQTRLADHVTSELRSFARAKNLRLQVARVDVVSGEFIPHG